MTKTVLFVGDARVGKTTLIKWITKGEFEKEYFASTGLEGTNMEFCPLSENFSCLSDGTHTLLSFYDCTGQERYRGRSYDLINFYRGVADLIVIMFSLDDQASYKNIEMWKRSVSSGSPDVPVLILASKQDLARDDLLIMAEEERIPIISLADPESVRAFMRTVSQILGLKCPARMSRTKSSRRSNVVL